MYVFPFLALQCISILPLPHRLASIESKYNIRSSLVHSPWRIPFIPLDTDRYIEWKYDIFTTMGKMMKVILSSEGGIAHNRFFGAKSPPQPRIWKKGKGKGQERGEWAKNVLVF